MRLSTVEMKEDGLHLSSDQLESLGWRPGERIELSHSGDCLTLRPSGASEKSIVRTAMAHLEDAVGFNTGIERPIFVGDRFEVKAHRSYDWRFLGTLFYTEEGLLIREDSTPDAEMRDQADAP